MAEAKLSKLWDLLQCGVCFKLLENARFLSCMHTFCAECINKIDGNPIKCPICRGGTAIGQAPLKPNVIVNSIIEELKKPHTDVCEAHGNVELKFFCEKCDEFVCSECALRSHAGHSFLVKDVRELSKAKLSEAADLLARAASWMEIHRSFASEFETAKLAGNAKVDQLVSDIETCHQLRLMVITDRLGTARDKLVAEVNMKRKMFNAALDHILLPETEAISTVSVLMDEWGKLNKYPKDVLLQFKRWVKALSPALEVEVPCRVNALQKNLLVNALRFGESPDPFPGVIELGSVRQMLPNLEDVDTANKKPEEPVLERPAHRLFPTERVQLPDQVKVMAPFRNGSIIAVYCNGQVEILHPDGTTRETGLCGVVHVRDVTSLKDDNFATLAKMNTVKIRSLGNQNDHSIKLSEAGADAIAADANGNLAVLFPQQGRIGTFSLEEDRCLKTIDLAFPVPNPVSQMIVTSAGNTVIIGDGAVFIINAEGGLIRKMNVKAVDKVSCDGEGNLWVLTQQKIRNNSNTFLEIYSQDGRRLAESFVPCGSTAGSAFSVMGVAASSNSFVAHISPYEIVWFLYE